MTTSSRWWLTAFIVVVFLAGASVGVIVDRAWLLRQRSAATGPGVIVGLSGTLPGEVVGRGVIDANMWRLRNRLQLTPEQEAAARPIVQAFVERVRSVQQSTREAMVSEAEQFEAALSGLSPALSAEQQERLQSYRSELLLPAPVRGRGRFGLDGGRLGRGGEGRSGAGREGPARPGGPGRE